MAISKKTKIFKLIIFILTIAILIGLTIYFFPIMRHLFEPDGREAFEKEIKSAGPVGIFLLFGLEAVQIFLPILPGEPIEILAGMCYGPVGGTLFIIISVAIITAIIFFIVRKLGRKFVCDMCSEEQVKKIENSKLFKNPKKAEYIMLILFLIPGTPKDLLVYIAGLLPINPLRFIVITTFARIPSIVSSTIAGNTLVAGNWKMIILVYAITFAIVGLIIYIFNKLDKSKLTHKILKNVKEKNDI